MFMCTNSLVNENIHFALVGACEVADVVSAVMLSNCHFDFTLNDSCDESVIRYGAMCENTRAGNGGDESSHNHSSVPGGVGWISSNRLLRPSEHVPPVLSR